VHPVVVLVPALAMILGPRLWVGHVLKRHNRRDLASARRAGELARELLDKNQLQGVKVETTDVSDHYDPENKAVRLGRDKIDRRTLTALTTAAHEVAHAMQDASGYGPFVWRTRLVKVAQRAGEVGAVLFLAVPLSAILSSHPAPPLLIGSAAVAILGTGVVAQLVALPSELDASFARALPLLRDGYISEEQAKDARRILWACSLTYVASSLVAVLQFWPWIHPLPALPITTGPDLFFQGAPRPVPARKPAEAARRIPFGVPRYSRRKGVVSLIETLVRPIGKPLIRLWLRVAEAP
jgi:Zn-dependent membrane protease YugP